MNTLIAVNAKRKTVIGNPIHHRISELHDVLLLSLVAGWVVHDLPHDAGFAGPQDIVIGRPH
jgi:hypothetical protein